MTGCIHVHVCANVRVCVRARVCVRVRDARTDVLRGGWRGGGRMDTGDEDGVVALWS